jgi:YaiO family outer membrane protein
LKLRLLPLLGLLLVSAAPPPGEGSDYDRGVAARHAGDNERAIALLRSVVAVEPDNADAHLQLGLALLAAGRLDEAERSLRRTIEIAPAYEDAHIALARLAQRRGDRAGALRQLEAVNPANPEAAGLRTQLEGGAAADRRWQVNIDGSYSSLDEGRQDWREGTVNVRYQASETTAVGATVEAARRFGETDVYGELRLDQRVSEDAWVYVSAGATPNADFRPEWQVGAGGSLRVRSGPTATVLTIDARQARYRAGDIQTVAPGIEQYVAGGRAWLTGRWINIFDERGRHHSGWLARGDLQASDRVRLFAGAADAPDVSEGIVLDTFSLFGGISVDFTERTTLRLSLAHEDRERGSDRLQFGLGLGLRF